MNSRLHLLKDFPEFSHLIKQAVEKATFNGCPLYDIDFYDFVRFLKINVFVHTVET